MKTVCVYLGASFGSNESFKEAFKLAQALVKNGLTLIYGGSSLGLMGHLASTVKEEGGAAIGVTTQFLLDKETLSTKLDQLHIVDSIQERKKLLQRLADAFIVMPGGLGTLEEAFETWNAINIGELNKTIGFLNIDGYFDRLFGFAEHCKDNGFINHEHLSLPIVSNESSNLTKD